MNGEARGISPVVGIALLVAVVVTLAAVSGGMLIALSEEPEPAPDVVLSMQEGDALASHVIKHKSGDELDGGRVELQGTADSEALSGTALSAGNGEEVFATDETIEVVWVADDGTSYVLRTFEVDSDETVPEPDEECEWVEDESNDGSDSITIDGITVNCDVKIDEQVEVQNGGVVIGDTVSNSKDVDADGATFYGDAETEEVFNLQDGLVTGSVTSETADVKLGNATVSGSATGEKVVELQKNSTVEGDATSTTNQVKVLNGSTVEGDAVSRIDQVKVTDGTVQSDISGDSVDLDGATVEGHVYVDSANFDCTDSTINGQDCGDYSPKDPDNY